jgi:hypothetical protein
VGLCRTSLVQMVSCGTRSVACSARPTVADARDVFAAIRLASPGAIGDRRRSGRGRRTHRDPCSKRCKLAAGLRRHRSRIHHHFRRHLRCRGWPALLRAPPTGCRGTRGWW